MTTSPLRPAAAVSNAPLTTRLEQSPALVLAIAVLGISFAAPLIRLSSAPALAIATWRLGFAMVIIGMLLVVTGGWRAWRGMTRSHVMLSVGAGALLAMHFWSWNVSLQYTTVAASVSLVSMQPIIIAIISARWLNERASGGQWIAIVLAVVGAVVIGWADVPAGGSAEAQSRALLGDALALVGAVTGALYYLIGRRVRPTLPLWPYVGLVYGAAFVVCLGLALVTQTPLGPQPPRELAIFAGLAIGPMLLGHTGMNWALAHLPAYVVNLTTLGEPVGATLLAALLPGIAEVPGPWTLLGGALVLTGVVLATRRRGA